MIGIFHRFFRSLVEIEPSVSRRRIMGFSAGQLRALLSVARVYPPGLWSASADALRSVVLRAYEQGQISDEQVEDIK
jgi:type II secretory pathway component PulK